MVSGRFYRPSNIFTELMPSRNTVGPAGTESKPQSSSSPGAGAPFEARTTGRRVVVVGAPGDVPRALEHPAVGRGRLHVAAVLAVDVESEDGLAGIDRLADLLDSHEAEAILVAGPVG